MITLQASAVMLQDGIRRAELITYVQHLQTMSYLGLVDQLTTPIGLGCLLVMVANAC